MLEVVLLELEVADQINERDLLVVLWHRIFRLAFFRKNYLHVLDDGRAMTP